MTEKQILEEYKYLIEEYAKIDRENTKKFCLNGLGVGAGSLALEIITGLEIICPIYLLGIVYFGTKNILNPDSILYPIINHSLYKESLKIYQQCNKRIAETMINTKENDPAFFAGIYQRLLNRGYLSYNGKIYNDSNQNHYFILPPESIGLHIVNGHCINRYVTFHFKDILNEIGLTNATIPVFLNDNISEYLKENSWNFVNELSNETDIDNKSKIEEFIESQFAKCLGNWWINVCKSNNKNEVYYIDIINETFYQRKNKNNLEMPDVSSEKKLGIRKKDYTLPTKFLAEKYYSLKGNKNLATALLEKDNVSNKETEAIYTYGKKYVDRNIQDFEKLYLTNQESFLKISNNLNNLGNTIQKYREDQITRPKTKILK